MKLYFSVVLTNSSVCLVVQNEYMWATGCDEPTHCPLGDVAAILEVWFANSHRVVARELSAKLLSDEYRMISIMRSQH